MLKTRYTCLCTKKHFGECFCIVNHMLPELFFHAAELPQPLLHVTIEAKDQYKLNFISCRRPFPDGI